MPLIDGGLNSGEFFVPASLLTSVPGIDGDEQEVSNQLLLQHQPDGIHVPKKRKSAKSTVPVVVQEWETGRHGTSSNTILRGGLPTFTPTTENDRSPNSSECLDDRGTNLRLHWRESIQHPEPREDHTLHMETVSIPFLNNGTDCPSLPVDRYGNSATKPRNSRRESLYDRTSLVHIKHQRKRWLRLLIEYGVYTALISLVYFILIGVPLWKGAVCWLYWLMQHKLIFSGGWTIAIALLIL